MPAIDQTRSANAGGDGAEGPTFMRSLRSWRCVGHGGSQEETTDERGSRFDGRALRICIVFGIG